MDTLPPWMVAELWQTVAEHPRRWCPTCKTRRCGEQAEARGQLITHGLWPPPEDDRSQQATGGARRT